MEGSGAILTAIFAVFSAVGEWIVTFIPSVLTLFYADGALTILGVLAVVSLAISIFFLIVGLIQRFLHFGG